MRLSTHTHTQASRKGRDQCQTSKRVVTSALRRVKQQSQSLRGDGKTDRDAFTASTLSQTKHLEATSSTSWQTSITRAIPILSFIYKFQPPNTYIHHEHVHIRLFRNHSWWLGLSPLAEVRLTPPFCIQQLALFVPPFSATEALHQQHFGCTLFCLVSKQADYTFVSFHSHPDNVHSRNIRKSYIFIQ